MWTKTRWCLTFTWESCSRKRCKSLSLMLSPQNCKLIPQNAALRPAIKLFFTRSLFPWSSLAFCGQITHCSRSCDLPLLRRVCVSLLPTAGCWAEGCSNLHVRIFGNPITPPSLLTFMTAPSPSRSIMFVLIVKAMQQDYHRSSQGQHISSRRSASYMGRE